MGRGVFWPWPRRRRPKDFLLVLPRGGDKRSADDPDFLDVLDKFVEKADETNVMAFVSSWGEANPGGGKDRVEYFIERSKNNVKESRDELAKVIKILDLKVE